MQSSGKAAVVRILAGAVAVLLAITLTGGVARAAARSRGNVRVLAVIPPPGYPAYPDIVGHKIYEGTYDDPEGSSYPSRVLEYNDSGEWINSWTVHGQDTSQAHGIQVAANTANGKLVLLDDTSGRIILLNPKTGRQTLYGRVPHIPPCSTAPAGSECKDSTQDLTPEPDYAAWGPDGSLYITDYQQATIWRVPPRGGTAKIWLTSALLDGGQFGTACLVMMPSHHKLLFDQASNGGLGSLDTVVSSVSSDGLDPATGKVYEIPIESGDRPGPPTKLWESGPADAPDGCVLTKSGHIFVALSGVSNQVVELSSSGQQIARFGQQYTGDNNSSVPFDTPSGLGCHGTNVIIANQAYLDGNTANMALLDLETGERCAPVYVPKDAGVRAVAKHKRKRHRARPKPTFTG